MRGEGRVFQRGRIWQIAYYAPGKDGKSREIYESSRSESESVARKFLKDRTRQVANHRGGGAAFVGPKAERILVGEMLDSLESDYRQRGIKSLRRSLNHMKHVRDFFGHHRAVGVTPEMIDRFIELARGAELSNATINRRLEVLSAAFQLAIERKRIAQKPHVPHLPEKNARKGFFERHEHELMLKHLPAPMDDMARFAYACGWRKDEVRTLRWENVDRAAREVRIDDSKNGEGRVLPLDDELWAMFERLWALRQYDTLSGGVALSEYVFHRNGHPIADSHFTKLWAKARTAAGSAVAHRIFHDYRRTAARDMIRAGVQQAVAKKITGHVTDSMFQRYNITSTDDQLNALQKRREYANQQPKVANVTEFRKSESGRG